MSSFDFFEEQKPGKQNSLEEVVQQIVNQSFDFDEFDAVEEKGNEESFNSDFFNSEPKPDLKMQKKESLQARSESFDFDKSRNISEISYMSGQSFRFEQQGSPPVQIQSNERYNKLQTMLSQAKKNNLDMFYRNLDQQNVYQTEDKFNNKVEFSNYRNQLKGYKRERENAFTGKNGNYQFRDNKYQPTGELRASGNGNLSESGGNPFLDSEKDFKKRKSGASAAGMGMDMVQGDGKSKGNDFFEEEKPQNGASNNMLPVQYEKDDDNFDFFEMGEEEINKEVNKYQEKQYNKEAENFFTSQEKQVKPKKKAPIQLSEIRQERPNLFELTHQEEKMTKLVQNYQEMKCNFNDLMLSLKQTNGDQEKIVSELKNLKNEYENKESRLKVEASDKEQKRQLREQAKEEKEKKIGEIREEIGRARENDKDLLYLKINQKIEGLQSIVKSAITEMHTEKDQKFVPKIINYYQEGDPKTDRSKNNSQLGLSREGSQAEHDDSRSRSQINDFVDQMAPMRNMINQMKEDKKEQQVLYRLDEFSSPLQLDLTTQEFPLNLSRNRSQQLEIPFVAPEGAKVYSANSLDPTNKYLRRCLTQKSSIIFESFEFYITGRFLMTNVENAPVTCEIRVANKCAVSLYDVFVVVFGPQAQEGELQMRPAKMINDQLKQNTSFLFEVDLSKVCLESGGFSVMISYKTDSVNKKKVIFKVVLPFVQLIKPEFIYQQQFLNGWNHMANQIFVNPQTLDFKTIRSHQDLKLILPLIEVTETDPNAFSYGIMFHYPTSSTAFMMKITCYVNGKASIHLKSGTATSGDRKLREQILDIMSYLCFG